MAAFPSLEPLLTAAFATKLPLVTDLDFTVLVQGQLPILFLGVKS